MMRPNASGRIMKKLVRPLVWSLFVAYCLILSYVLFLSRPLVFHISYGEYFSRYTNFVPFDTVVEYVVRYRHGFRSLSLLNLVGNFLLFFPMGLMLPCLFSKLRRFWKTAVCLLGIVVAVELTQGFLRVGSIDVDDVIFNVCGGMLGYSILRISIVRRGLARLGLSSCDETSEDGKGEI